MPNSVLQAASDNAAIIVFVVYIAGVLALAVISNRVRHSKSFLSEYFLGGRSLGVWAFALTFAATSASGGSFIGFPSLVYTHGWVVALWIGSYMIVPLVSMGLLAKRVNQVARKTGAITIPDMLRDRFESPAFGILSTALIAFFLTFNLVAQFKGGSVILQTLMTGMPWFESAKDFVSALFTDGAVLSGLPFASTASTNPGYTICLLVFAVAVVFYTTFGGFRAVVWTDVLQGFVMVGGVVVMLPIAIWAAGGLDRVTTEMANMTPPDHVAIEISRDPSSEAMELPANTWLESFDDEGDRRVFRTKERARFPEDQSQATALDSDRSAADAAPKIAAIELTYQTHIDEIDVDTEYENLQVSLDEPADVTPYAFGRDQAGVYASGPGPSPSEDGGFLPICLAISFFFMWTFSGAGQPSNMVRLMAFRDSATLRKAIFTMSIYYSLIYFPLVIIFCCARVLLPGWETESDRIMPEMASFVTAAIEAPWLAGLLVAAPFAAVMSTMDSFLLMISSALVRDIYQRLIRPNAREKTIKRLTYAVTLAIGLGAMFAALNPPRFLQDIIVFTGSGLSSSFLVPVVLAMYWPRFNKYGAFAGMLTGFIGLSTLYGIGFIQFGEMRAFYLLGFHPFLVGVTLSLIVAVIVTLASPKPPEHLVAKFFLKEAPDSTSSSKSPGTQESI